MTTDEAYAFCRAVARTQARNFYYGFVLLPPERRAGIYAAYAFSRRADDSVDEGGSTERRVAAVARLRGELDACAAGTAPPDDPVLVALSDTMRRFSIPRRHLDALIDGVEMDITIDRYADFAALKGYCDRVAGAVGLVSLHIFGFRDPAAPGHAAESSTSCATSPRTPNAAASICPPTRWPHTASPRRTSRPGVPRRGSGR